MSADSPNKQKKFCEKQSFEFPMLCDERKKLCKLMGYGERKNSWVVSMKAFFEIPISLMKRVLSKRFIKKSMLNHMPRIF